MIHKSQEFKGISSAIRLWEELFGKVNRLTDGMLNSYCNEHKMIAHQLKVSQFERWSCSKAEKDHVHLRLAELKAFYKRYFFEKQLAGLHNQDLR